jgi:hypothetical protein
MGRLAGGSVVLALLLALIAPAAASADEQLLVSGSVTYSWHGDPSRGCAAVGLCGVEGAVIVDPQGSADTQRVAGRTFVNFEFPDATVRVLEGNGECVDTPGDAAGQVLVLARGAHGGLVGQIQQPLSSGRCPGPIAQDLSGLDLPVRKTGGKLATFDMRGSRPFAAGPFSGTVVSSVVLRPDRSGSTTESSSGSGTTTGTPTHKILLERVTLRYRLAPLTGGLEIPFSGDPEPVCALLDSCGTRGTLLVSAAGASVPVTLTASRRVAGRVGARRALADLRRGRLGQPSGFAMVHRLDVAETLFAADGSRCDASAQGSGVALSFGAPGRGSVTRVTLSGLQQEVMRTYCPGPSTADVADSGVLGTATVPVAQLLRRQSDLMLADPGSFDGIGYSGTRTDGIGFSMVLEGIRAGTVEEERG